IEPLSSDLVSDWEGCLSIPEIRGRVPRYEGVRVTALNKEGRPVVFDAHGYLARVIQHEVDHLDGVLFLDRMEDFSSLCFLEEYGKYHRE
ncbi:MAG: peptide deformylase, partial [bacterium]|nr:peptide deformylase [bacterium]